MPLIIDGEQDTDLGDWDQLIDEVLLHLSGYVEDQEVVATLSASASDSTSEFSLSSADGFSKGLVEVGEELLYVQRVDTSTARLVDAIRGFRGSTAATHAAGTEVRDNPRFPRVAVRRAMEATLRATWPRLFAVDAVEIETTDASQYELPADCSQVLTVDIAHDTTALHWVPLPRWSYIGAASSAVSSTGKAIKAVASSGQTLRVTYAKRPPVPANGQNWSTTGLPDSSRDVIVFGACARLASMAEVGRGSAVAAEAQALQQTRPAGSGLQIGRYFLALYEQRLAEEQLALQQQVKIRSHKEA